MMEIQTGIPALDDTLRQIQELLQRSDLQELLASDTQRVMEVIPPRVFRLIVVLASAENIESKFEGFDGQVLEKLQVFSMLVAENFGEFLGSQVGETLMKASEVPQLVDDIYESVSGVGHSCFLLDVSNGLLMPHMRASFLGSQNNQIATITMEWDDCLHVCSALISILSKQMDSFLTLMKQEMLMVNVEDLENKLSAVSKALIKLEKSIGGYRECLSD